MQKLWVWIAVWGLFYGVVVTPSDGQSLQARDKIRAVYNAIGTGQSPLWIPHEAGIFRKYGLDVELLYVGGGSRAAQVVVSGEAPIGIFNGGSVVSANLSGGDLVTIASALDVLPFFLVAPPTIKKPEDLQGKKIGITRFGSATDFALRYVAEKWSMKPQRNFAVLQLGGQPEMMAALKSGSIQAAMLNVEFAILAGRDGYINLVDVGALGLAFPASSLNTSRSFIRKNPDLSRRFVRAYVEGIHYAKTHRQFSIDVISRYLKNVDSAFLNAVYEAYVLRFIPKNPSPSLEAVKTVLAQMAESDPRARAVHAEQFIDASLVQELEKKGFIQQLWK